MKKIIIFSIIISSILTKQSYTQEIETLMDLNANTPTEVTTASKSAEKLSDAPGIVSVITKEEITAFGAVTLTDILNRATSVYMIQGGTYPSNISSIRGQFTSVFNNHTLLLIDGRPLKDGIIGVDNIFFASFPIDLIERIEIIRGPGSVLYGTNAFSGVINIITKNNHDPYLKLSSQDGSFGTHKQTLSGSTTLKNGLKIDFSLNNMMHEGPEYTFMDGPKSGGSQEGTGNFSLQNHSLFARVEFEGFSYTSYYANMSPFALIAPIKWKNGNISAGENAERRHFYNDIGYTHKFNDKYSIEAKLTSNERQNIGASQTREKEIEAVSKNTLVELSFYAKPIDKFNLVLGGYFENNLFLGSVLQAGEQNKFATYAQADYTLFNKLKLIIGSQIVKPSNLDLSINPRYGIVYNATKNFGIKALHATAYRNPYPKETDIIHPVYTGSHDLSPEIITTSDFQLFYQNENINLSFTAYNSEMNNMINKVKVDGTPNPIGDTVQYAFKNIGTHKFQGLELEGKYNINIDLTILGSFIYQQNQLNDSLTNAAYWPQMIGKLGFMYNRAGYSIGVWNSYFGKPSVIENPDVENPQAEAYNLLTANVSFDIFKILGKKTKKKLIFSIFADNLLDADIWYPEFARKEISTLPLHGGRSIYGKLSFTL